MAGETPGGKVPKDKPYVAGRVVLIGAGAFWGGMALGVGRRTFGVMQPIALWGLAALIILVLLALAGREINGQWLGVLIDTRNKMSLSRLQITLWTVMVLSAYLTMVMPRVIAMVGKGAALTQEQALDITFPEELILAMGISAASFAGANLIQTNKKKKQIKIEAKATPESALERRNQAKKDLDEAESKLAQLAQDEADRKKDVDAAEAKLAQATSEAAKEAAGKKRDKAQTQYDAVLQDKEKTVKDRDAKKKALQEAEEDLAAINEAQGLLHKNADPSEAGWADLFRGEEIANYKLVDMSKVQMLLFTVAVIAAYSACIASMLLKVDVLRTAASLSFPDFGPSMNALLGISHGTYLSVKTVDHS
jgi:cell division protein FtsL